MEVDRLICGDYLVDMNDINDHSADMILCDLPYGTTACKWDTIIPFEPLWAQYKRIIKPNGAIVLTASQPFTSRLVMSNIEWFKYEWIWRKSKPTGFINAKNAPLKKHENIIVFSSGTIANRSDNRMSYYPQGLIKSGKIKKSVAYRESWGTRPSRINDGYIQEYTNFPNSVLSFANDSNTNHPTQKPVALFEYLIRTYTNEGDLVLDNCAGSFTTAVACIRTKRHYICIEKEAKYCEIGRQRIEAEMAQLTLI